MYYINQKFSYENREDRTMNLREALNKAIKAQQGRYDITNRELAEALNVSETQIVKYRSGITPWQIGKLDTIAHTLKLESGWELLELAKNEASIAEHIEAA